MLHPDARSIPNISYKINSRGPICLVACRDARLAMMMSLALEEHHCPAVLVPSDLGFRQPRLMQPDVVIMNEPMVQDLEAIVSRETRKYISQIPMLFLGAVPVGSSDRAWLQPHVTLPLSAGSSESVQTVYTLAQTEAADGRPINPSTDGQSFYLTPPVPTVSWRNCFYTQS